VLDCRIEKINMRCYGDQPPEFLAKVPRGLLPVVELDGKVITESSEIMKVLEYEFRDNPLLPPETQQLRCEPGTKQLAFCGWLFIDQ
jgi:glutathione S-transferase